MPKGKRIIIATILCVVVFLIYFLRNINPSELYAYLDDYSVNHPILVVFFCVVLQIVVILLGVFPASVSVVGAGVVFGMIEGFILSASCVLVGSILAFGLSRSLMRNFILRLWGQNTLFLVLEETINQKGWRAVCLLRLSPILPFAITNYAIGLTKVSFKDYFIGTLFSLPPLFGYVLIGALTRSDINCSVKGGVAGIKIVIDGVYVIATVFLIWYTGKILSKHMKKAL